MPDNFPTESELKTECRTDEGAGLVHAEGPTPGQPPVQPIVHDESRKANTLNRCIARFIDILFALLLNKLPGYVGLLAGLTYLGIADGLMGGKSIGKKIIGLRVIRRKDGRKADFRASILRNSTIGVMYLVFNVPIVGWVLAALGMAFELMLIIGSAEGMRLGDEIASTMVADDPEAA
jgi:uncharacterized RDD family membrane protein YckC